MKVSATDKDDGEMTVSGWETENKYVIRGIKERSSSMHEYDSAVLKVFLKKQSKLFPEGDVVSSIDEAEAFLEDCMAVVVDSAEEVLEYFEEAGIDVEGAGLDDLSEIDEVFEIGDGRYLIVEG